MSVFILRYGLPDRGFQKLADISLNEVHLLEGSHAQGQTVADLQSEDELIVFSSPASLFFRRNGVKCKISVMVREPRAVQLVTYWALRAFGHRFHRVLTHDDYIMQRVPHAERWIHGGTLIEPDNVGEVVKSKRVSIIASKKRWAKGHALRHHVINWSRYNHIELDVFGGGYQWIETKIDGHKPYCFSVVIENSSSAGYFSEQILDCMLCETVPIYWGDPDIGDFFDARGIIVCKNLGEIIDVLTRIKRDDYADFKEAIAKNKQRALDSLSVEKCMWRISR